MPNPFKRPELREQYAEATRAYATGHADLVWVDGTPHRGSAQAQAFWDGFDGEGASDFTKPEARTATTYAWWRAGQDAKRLHAAPDFSD